MLTHKQHQQTLQPINKLLHPHKTPKLQTLNAIYYLTDQFAQQIPNKYQLIIGIPRAGLLIATIIALKHGKPLSTPSHWYQNREIWKPTETPNQPVKNILLCEDNINNGTLIFQIQRELQQQNFTVDTASLYATKQAQKQLTYYYLTQNATLEHNLQTSATTYMGNLATDLDGILCNEQTGEPYLIPNQKLQAVISTRPTWQYRQTKQWLIDNNIKFKHLILTSDKLWSLQTAIKEYKIKWYWESNPTIAQQLANKTKIPIYCPQTQTIYKKRWIT